jgi:peptide deformylase
MLNIIKNPNEILRKKSKEIDRPFLALADTQNLIAEMIETMYAGDGVGLAAPQIGKNIRLVVIGKDATKNGELALINPVWEKINRKTKIDVEGCLSIPKTSGKVKRWKDIRVCALDQAGNQLNFEASDLFARVIQHEVDHLDGILFIDKANDIVTEK